MADEVQVLELVLATVREEAEDLDYDALRNAAADTPLYGGDSGIDSLSLVRLIVAVESAAARRFGLRVALADEKALSLRNSPFRTVGTLALLLRDRLDARNA